MPDISVVIVTWNSDKVIGACLEAVCRRETGAAPEVMVVDNASTDRTLEKLTALGHRVRLICNSVNRGYARAVNQGIRACRGETIILLNPDTVPEPDSLSGLADYLDNHPRVGLVGGELVDRDGRLQESVRAFPGYLNLALRPTSPLTRLLSRDPFRRPSHRPNRRSKGGPVDSVAGTFLGIRRRILEDTGLFDENYFMYVEDMDLCYRARRAGWEVHYLPGVRAYHQWGGSTRLSRRKMVAEHARSMYRFMLKHKEPGWVSRIFLTSGLGFYAVFGRVGPGRLSDADRTR